MTTVMPSATITSSSTHIMKPQRPTRSRFGPDGNASHPRRSDDRDSTDMSTAEEPPEREFRSRRSHRKSRMGCMRCKQARRKCDELKPRCSRCTARDADCKYPERPSTSPQAESFLDLPAELDDDFWTQLQAFSLPTPSAFPNVTTRDLSSAASSIPSPFPNSPILTSAELESRAAEQALDVRESELLSHYLSHTARAFAYDTDDLYALQIGYPSLAFRSALIMKSVLALAAVCKCHDVLSRSRAARGSAQREDRIEDSDVAEMRELLALADRYHNESLSQTQAEITGASYYEFALANAPLMVLYGLASQSIRIQLIDQNVVSAQGEAPSEFTPAHSQWIYLIRAAHEAHSGMSLGSGQAHSPHVPDLTSASKMVSSPPPPLGCGSTPDPTLIQYDGRSSRNTKQLLLPIVSATCHNALEGVRSKAMAMHLAVSTQPAFIAQDPGLGERDQLQACIAALDVLTDIASKVCGHGPSSLTSSPMATPGSSTRQGVALPSWLQDYLARVTHAAPSQATHRAITSFVNRVPSTYLNIVQDVLATVPVETATTGSWQGQDLSPLQQLTMDILAHWLVFVMLLDDIWWIGEIGGWELRRVGAVMKAVGWAEEGQWWPESMFRIRSEVDKHRR